MTEPDDGFCAPGAPPRTPAEGSLPARGVPSRTPAEGSLPARGVPSRTPAEGSLPARGVPSRTPAEGSGLLFAICAPSGAGKTSLVRALTQADSDLAVSVSHTTRRRRVAEVDGRDYHFIDSARFVAMAAAGEFLEHAEVFGHRYGTAAKEVAAKQAGGRDVILEIDWQGAAQVRRQAPGLIGVFVLPPSRHTLQERLAARGADSPESIAERLVEARSEMSRFADFDYLVVNDDFNAALDNLRAIVQAERLKTPVQAERQRALIAGLLS